MSKNIVSRLRQWSDDGSFQAEMDIMTLFAEAADEIERLREELTASHESHGNEVGSLTERLSLAIHERDEARREICLLREEVASLRQTIARYQEVSVEWIRATQERARMIEGSIE